MYGAHMTTLQQQAADAIRSADFRISWPIEVRKALVRAAQTDGEMPAYAVKEVTWALKAARGIERRMRQDIVVGEASLSHAQRKALAVR